MPSSPALYCAVRYRPALCDIVTRVLACLGCYTGTLVGRLAAVTEQVEELQASLQQKVDTAVVEGAKHQLKEARQQGHHTQQALTNLQSSLHQQGQDQATALQRLEALIATSAQGMHQRLY